MKVELKAAIAN